MAAKGFYEPLLRWAERFALEVRGVRAPWATEEASTPDAERTTASTAAGKRVVRSGYFSSHTHVCDECSSEDDEPPRSRQAVGRDETIMQAGMMLDRHSRRRQEQRMDMRDLGGGVRHT